MRYRSVRPDDAPIREAMKKVASERCRFGYRRIHVMLDRHSSLGNITPSEFAMKMAME